MINRPVTDNMITCLTPPISDEVVTTTAANMRAGRVARAAHDTATAAASTATIVVTFDGGVTRQPSSAVFTYYQNPVVIEVTPRRSYRR